MIDPEREVTLLCGDVMDALAQIPSGCVDAVITDPPYNINIKGSAGWDSYGPRAFSQWCEQWAAECLRVLKPGGWLFSFGSGKSWHRMVVGVEDAGFELMDSITWIYAAAMRRSFDLESKLADIADPELRERLAGRSYALANRHDPIAVGRKRPASTMLGSVAEHGSGTLDVISTQAADGSWPANAVISHHEDCELDRPCVDGCPIAELGPHADGFPSFYWCPKASAAEKVSVDVEVGQGTNKLFHIDTKRWRCRQCGVVTKSYLGSARMSEPHQICEHDDWEPLHRDTYSHTITHPSPKPLDLMRWLVRLAAPPHGLILDCFAGSGATAEAAVLDRRRSIAVERDSQYLELVKTRLRRQYCQRADAEQAGELVS